MTEIESKIIDYIKKGDVQQASVCIKQALRSGVDLSSNSVLYSHVLALSAPWSDISKLIPPAWNTLFISGWLNSIAKGKPVDVQGRPIPWFTYPSIEFIETIMKPGWSVFEWGSGNSTMWWSSNVKSVRAVENNHEWYSTVKANISENASVSYAADVDSYVGCYLESDIEAYDVVVVDGVFRNECAKVALQKLKPTGIVVFDNSDRIGCDLGLQFLVDSGLFRLDFWGMIPSFLYKNCTSIFLSDANILKGLSVPSKTKSDLGPSCSQYIDRK